MSDDRLAVAAAIAKRELGARTRMSPLPSGKHGVFRTSGPSGEHVLKLYGTSTAAELIPNCELAAYQHLGQLPAVRTPSALSWGTADEPSFAILPYVEGPTLLEHLASAPSRASADRLIAQVVEYARSCGRIATEGFGNLRADLTGATESWPDFLDLYLSRAHAAMARLAAGGDKQILVELWERLRGAVAGPQVQPLLERAEPRLVPIDLNLTNFLVADGDRLVVLDLDAFWGSDPLLALGEWAGHAYGTRHYSLFLRRWGPLEAAELRLVRLYALLSNFDVALFVASQTGRLGDEAPWGNSIALARLGRLHADALSTDDDPLLPERLVLAGALPTDDWGAKPEPGTSRGTVDRGAIAARLEAAIRPAGITRVADITGLDETGIHVAQAVRPAAEPGEHTFTVFSGKGPTAGDARLAAIAEALERRCGERGGFDPARILVASYERLSAEAAVVHPREFNMPAGVGFSHAEEIEWVVAHDLVHGGEVSVPANVVFYPYVPARGRLLFRHFTAGLATGASYVEAVAHGLAEVIERDAAALNRILRNNRALDIDTIDSPQASELLRRMRRASLEVIVRWITAPDLPVPAFSVICEPAGARDPLFVSGGYGAHPNKQVALLHALSEAAQSRCGTISGAREDLQKFQDARAGLDYETYRRKYRYWFDTSGERLDYRALPSRELPTALDDVAVMCDAVAAAGFERVLAVDLSRPEFALPVVKVLVPGVERYSFKMRCVGERARRGYRSLYGRELRVPGD